MPQLAIAEAILEPTKKIQITYLGSYQGMEKALCERAGIPFEPVSTGKFRRYFDLKNLVDIFRVPLGIVQAWVKLQRLKPNVVFSKGGFVGVPVVVAAWLLRIPIVIHESDTLPGLATKLTAPLAQKILLGFKETREFLGRFAFKSEWVGNPIRDEILKGSASQAQKETGFDGKRKVLLIMGGSSGAQEINEMIAKEKKTLCEHFDVIHLFGKGKGRIQKNKHYYAVPYAHEDLKDFYALASFALSRAGASTLSELEALQLPSLLWPLGMEGSRGDQIYNAKAMVKHSKRFKLYKKNSSFLDQLNDLPKRNLKHKKNLSVEKIASILTQTMGKQ